MLNVDEIAYYSQYNTQQEHQLVVPDPGPQVLQVILWVRWMLYMLWVVLQLRNPEPRDQQLLSKKQISQSPSTRKWVVTWRSCCGSAWWPMWLTVKTAHYQERDTSYSLNMWQEHVEILSAYGKLLPLVMLFSRNNNLPLRINTN